MPYPNNFNDQRVLKPCESCGIPFSGHPTAKYCSPRCKARARSVRVRARALGGPSIYNETGDSRRLEYPMIDRESADLFFQYLRNNPRHQIIVRRIPDLEALKIPRDIDILFLENGQTVFQSGKSGYPEPVTLAQLKSDWDALSEERAQAARLKAQLDKTYH